MAKWAFHQRGVLRVSNVHHNKAGSAEQPDWYRITDDLDFALDIHELSDGAWKPYRCAAIQALRVSSGQLQASLWMLLAISDCVDTPGPAMFTLLALQPYDSLDLSCMALG